MNLKLQILMIGLGGLVFIGVIAGTESTPPTNSEVDQQLLRSDQLIAEQMCLEEEGRRIRLELLELSEQMQSFIKQEGVVLHKEQIYSPELEMLEQLTEMQLPARLEVRLTELRLTLSEGTQLFEDAKKSHESAIRTVELYEQESASLSEILTKREANYQKYQHLHRSMGWLILQREENQMRIRENRYARIRLGISEDNIVEEQEILEEEMRRVSLALLDLRDELQTFSKEVGLILHNGQIFSPEWEMLEMLTEKQLQARLEVRFAKLRVVTTEGTALAEDARKSLENAKRIVELYEQETMALCAILTKSEANYRIYRHMYRSIEWLELLKEDIRKRLLANQYELRLSSVTSQDPTKVE